MHFIVNREVILYPLIRVSTVISNSPAIPILSHALVRFGSGQLTLTGTNIEIQISETIEGIEVQDAQDFAFPAQTALEFCRKLKHGCDLSFTKDPQKDSLVIETIDSSGSNAAGDAGGEPASGSESASVSRLELQTIKMANFDDFDESGMVFPELRTQDSDWEFSMAVSRHSLQSIIRRSRHAMSVKETSRVILEAMLIEVTENEMRAVATDGHRLATNSAEIESAGLPEGQRQRAVVPRASIEMLSKLLSELTSSVELSIGNSHLRVQTAQVVFITKLMEGNYPEWQATIPINVSRTIRGSREELQNVLTRVNILSMWDKTLIAAKMQADGNVMKVHAQSIQAAGQRIDEEVDIVQNGDDADSEIGFQVRCKYFLDIFEAMNECEQFELNMIKQRDACVVKFPDDPSATFLVMLLKKR